ncbi:MAG: RNA polymerase sigma factor [Hyphomicrobiales bacterium]
MNEIVAIKKAKRGKSEAQKWIFNKYAQYIFRVCIRYMKYEAEAEEIMMTTFLKAFENINRFEYRDEGSIAAWLKTIAIRESLMVLRKKKMELCTIDDNVCELDPNTNFDIDAEYLYDTIRNLPYGYRTVINLNVIEGYSHKEISKMLNISESTSRSQLAKAKQLLRTKLERKKVYA